MKKLEGHKVLNYKTKTKTEPPQTIGGIKNDT